MPSKVAGCMLNSSISAPSLIIVNKSFLAFSNAISSKGSESLSFLFNVLCASVACPSISKGLPYTRSLSVICLPLVPFDDKNSIPDILYLGFKGPKFNFLFTTA